MHGNNLATKSAQLEETIARGDTPLNRLGAIVVPGNWPDGARAWNATQRKSFESSIDELNTRLRQAGTDLSYHNGFIQRTSDELSHSIVEAPFWSLLSNPKWINVDLDMKEALDLRDNDGRDPAFYAARALESTIKIICAEMGWTRGTERGAHNFIDNLASKERGFITPWESDALKRFFSEIRNPFGHGAGPAEMPSLTQVQTDWAIETCMSWIKSLIKRL